MTLFSVTVLGSNRLLMYRDKSSICFCVNVLIFFKVKLKTQKTFLKMYIQKLYKKVSVNVCMGCDFLKHI